MWNTEVKDKKKTKRKEEKKMAVKAQTRFVLCTMLKLGKAQKII